MAKCEMTAEIYFHAYELHLFTAYGCECRQQLLGSWYPINPALTRCAFCSCIKQKQREEDNLCSQKGTAFVLFGDLTEPVICNIKLQSVEAWRRWEPVHQGTENKYTEQYI